MKRKNTNRVTFESLVNGSEPLWNLNIPLNDEYLSAFIIQHSNWCNYNWDRKDYRKATLEYIKSNKKSKSVLSKLTSKNHDSFIFREIGNYCRMASLGCPMSDSIIQKINDGVASLLKESNINLVQNAQPIVKVDIQERIKSKTNELLETIELKVDSFIHHITMNDTYPFNALSWLQQIGVKGVHVEQIINTFLPRIKEIETALNGDKDLLEGYSFLGKAKTRKYLEFNTSIVDACKTIALNKRKPRKKKKISPEKVISKLKYMVEDTKLKIKSIDPRKIISCNTLITYNTKTKRASIFKSVAGLSVKGSSIINFDSHNSSSKAIRKENYIFNLTKPTKDVSLAYSSIKAKEKPVKYRINSDTLLLQAI